MSSCQGPEARALSRAEARAEVAALMSNESEVRRLLLFAARRLFEVIPHGMGEPAVAGQSAEDLVQEALLLALKGSRPVCVGLGIDAHEALVISLYATIADLGAAMTDAVALRFPA